MLVDCDACGAIVDAEILKQYEITRTEILSERFTFARCPRCKAPFVMREDEDIFESGQFSTAWLPASRIFPVPPSVAGARLPGEVRLTFEEARRCFSASAFTAATIMCRKTLEAICATHGVAESNLANSLKRLRDDGIIERRLYDWADALRISGNEAAHDVAATIGREDAIDVFDFTNALLEYVFTYRDRFEAFQRRRAKIALRS